MPSARSISRNLANPSGYSHLWQQITKRKICAGSLHEYYLVSISWNAVNHFLISQFNISRCHPYYIKNSRSTCIIANVQVYPLYISDLINAFLGVE
jgi:hypothetical protein